MSQPSSQLLEAAAWTIAPDAAFSEIRTIPGEGVLHAWRVLRLLAIHAADPWPSRTPPPFDRRGMQALETAILRADYDEALRFPLAVLARCLTPGAEPDSERLGWACLCAVEWAFTRGRAPGVGRSFAYAAARITGLAPYVEVARRLAAAERSRGDEAEATG